ncbi:MAG: uroporphyrin-III C-methyltransferase [Bradymonadia bacterium]|jgi:uroporphyrin-III C-methyltransferase
MTRTTTIAEPSRGRVALVGAGPGDPDLLTVRAFRRLRSADVVLYDNLVGEGVLQLAAGSRLINVGKIGGGRHTSQEVINRLLLREALDGNSVVRLKGGDPFVFGRGGEEAAFLAEHGVEVELVPGISNSIAAASAAMIPVTHRGVATHFSVVTGRGASADGTPLHVTWRRLSAAGGTVVFLMGLGRIEEIVEEIEAAGVPLSRAMAVVSAATTDRQAVVTGTVGTIAELVREAGLPTPATIVLGDVVAVRDQILGLHQTNTLPVDVAASAVG